jgi:hypothetical protein
MISPTKGDMRGLIKKYSLGWPTTNNLVSSGSTLGPKMKVILKHK